MRKTWLAGAALAITTAACATTPGAWQALDGSRADGTVTLGYEYFWMSPVEVSDIQGEALAAQRCKTWGYDGAEAFGGRLSTCVAGVDMCTRYRITMTYQCTGTGTPGQSAYLKVTPSQG